MGFGGNELDSSSVLQPSRTLPFPRPCTDLKMRGGKASVRIDFLAIVDLRFTLPKVWVEKIMTFGRQRHRANEGSIMPGGLRAERMERSHHQPGGYRLRH